MFYKERLKELSKELNDERIKRMKKMVTENGATFSWSEEERNKQKNELKEIVSILSEEINMIIVEEEMNLLQKGLTENEIKIRIEELKEDLMSPFKIYTNTENSKYMSKN